MVEQGNCRHRALFVREYVVIRVVGGVFRKENYSDRRNIWIDILNNLQSNNVLSKVVDNQVKT